MYFAATRSDLEAHGKQMAFYSDKHSIFRVNQTTAAAGTGVTQFARALAELQIGLICANSSAAKGRVGRARATTQGRLVKELRLAGVVSMKAANAFAPQFVADYNWRFGKAARSEHNAQRAVLATENLDDIFCWQEERSVQQPHTSNAFRWLWRLLHTHQVDEIDLFTNSEGVPEPHALLTVFARPAERAI